MKTIMKYRYIFLSMVFATTGILTSCEDFLTLYPTDKITEEEFWEDKKDLENVVAACYTQFSSSGVVDRMINWGETRSDNVVVRDVSNTTLLNRQAGILLPSDGIFEWGAFYTTINYCNTVLEHGEQVVARDPSFSKSDWESVKAEMIGLRALNYFYLIRSFRDVPAIFSAVTTDEAVKANAYQGQTDGLTLLTQLIEEVEQYKDKARIEFGDAAYNKGRITKRAMYALLADMYLWRGCMTAPSTAVTKATADATQSTSDLRNAIVNCDSVIAWFQEDRAKRMALVNSLFGGGSTVATTQKEWLLTRYPVIYNSFYASSMVDFVHRAIFGSGNSTESIFEVQYDGTKRSNSAVVGNYFVYDGAAKPQSYVGNPALFVLPTSVAPTGRGYGITDLRYPTTVSLSAGNQTEFPVVKFAATMVSNINGVKVGDIASPQDPPSYAYRYTSTMSAGWIVYRLSEIMLMKAEAIARLNDATLLKEAFWLTNAIYARSNPAAMSSTDLTASEDVRTTRLDTNYYSGKSAADLLALVYHERQREFVAEGKRWFDLVRMAEADGTTANALTYWGATKSLKTRLRDLRSFYNPVYESQIKINSSLKQNPIWESFSTAD